MSFRPTGFADALNELRPDLIMVLGDRFEIFAVVAVALVARMPVAHLHGIKRRASLFDATRIDHLYCGLHKAGVRS